MKPTLLILSALALATAALSSPVSCGLAPRERSTGAQKLHDTIVELDRVYFEAYNTCDMETQAEMYADDVEFFHDQAGLTNSKTELLESIEKNICGKVTRELLEGSIEVHPIKDYGAVQIGMHSFYNHEEGTGPSKPSRFIVVWKNDDGHWSMSRVISLH